MRLASKAALTAASIVLVSCAGQTKPVDGKTLAACLARHSGYYVSTKRQDLGAGVEKATDTGMVLDTPANKVAIAVDRTVSDAKSTQQDLERLVRLYDATGAVLERQGNVALLWTWKPSPRDRAAVDHCLAQSD